MEDETPFGDHFNFLIFEYKAFMDSKTQHDIIDRNCDILERHAHATRFESLQCPLRELLLQRMALVGMVDEHRPNDIKRYWNQLEHQIDLRNASQESLLPDPMVAELVQKTKASVHGIESLKHHVFDLVPKDCHPRVASILQDLFRRPVGQVRWRFHFARLVVQHIGPEITEYVANNMNVTPLNKIIRSFVMMVSILEYVFLCFPLSENHSMAQYFEFMVTMQ